MTPAQETLFVVLTFVVAASVLASAGVIVHLVVGIIRGNRRYKEMNERLDNLDRNR